MYQQECMSICGVIQLESSYKVVNLLTPEEISFLKDLYQASTPNFFRRDYNLFNIYKSHPPKNLNKERLDYFQSITQKVKTHCEKTHDHAHYFLKYCEGSFTSTHVDNPSTVGKTAVTLLDKSPDLLGGDAVLLNPIKPSMLFQGNVQPRDYDVNSHKILNTPVVVKQDIGTTLLYDQNSTHGVSLVERGFRLVFISWVR